MLLKTLWEKGENAGTQHFLLFPAMFSTLAKTSFNFSNKFILSSANAFNLDQSKILSYGEELIEKQHRESNSNKGNNSRKIYSTTSKIRCE